MLPALHEGGQFRQLRAELRQGRVRAPLPDLIQVGPQEVEIGFLPHALGQLDVVVGQAPPAAQGPHRDRALLLHLQKAVRAGGDFHGGGKGATMIKTQTAHHRHNQHCQQLRLENSSHSSSLGSTRALFFKDNDLTAPFAYIDTIYL